MIVEPPRTNAETAPETITDISSDVTPLSVPSITVHPIEDVAGLSDIATEWDRLAESALEPSPSSESWMLIPALRHLAAGSSITVLTMRAHHSAQAERGELCAVFALEVRDRYKGLPIPTVRLWDHLYSLCPTPLLHRDHAESCVRALFRWAADMRAMPTFVEFPNLVADSAFSTILLGTLRKSQLQYTITDTHQRAYFRPGPDARHYIESIGTPHARKEWRRMERRLGETGNLRYELLESAVDTASWVSEFVELEMKGWKGAEGSAFGCDKRHRAFLSDIVSSAQNRGRLMAISLRLDGRPVAMKLNFVTPPGGHTFKIAFDEAFAKYSPGTLLELENIRLAHKLEGLRWMDSLAAPNHPMIDRLWHDRVTIMTLLATSGTWSSKLLVSAIPVARIVWRKLKSIRRHAV